MTHDRYEEIVRGFSGHRLVVLGDLMMDEYLWGAASRVSPESPVLVVDIERESSVPGGAANVVNNLLELGADVSVVGVVGEDRAGEALKADLEDRGADVSGVVTDSSRPTTRKTRVVAHNQQLIRIDREKRHAVTESVQKSLMDRLRQLCDAACAVIVSDYNKGVLTPMVAREAVGAARSAGAFITANPKPANAGSLAGAHVLTLNQTEAQGLSGGSTFASDDGLDDAGMKLLRTLRTDSLVITRGSKGLSIWRDSGAVTHIPAHPVDVYDVAGAGDTVISALTIGLAAGAAVEEAAEVANHAAACVVRKVGVATVTPDELLADWWDR